MKQSQNINGWKFVWDSESGQPLSITKNDLGFHFNNNIMTFNVGGITPRNDRNQMYDVVGYNTIGGKTKFIKSYFSDNKIRLIIEFDNFKLQTEYLFKKEKIYLSFKLTNISKKIIRLRNGNWCTEFIKNRPLEKYTVIAPSYGPNMNIPYNLNRNISEYLGNDFIDLDFFGGGGSPGYRSGVIGVHGEGYGALSWYTNEIFTCHIHSFKSTDNSAQALRKIYCPCDLMPGDEIILDGLCLGLIEGSRSKAISLASKDFNKWRNQRAYTNEHLKIMEICVGEKMGRTAFNSFDEVIDKLPAIKDLGFNSLQIMPQMPFPTYSTFNLLDIETTYGDSKGLKKLIAKAYKLGLKVLCDIVLHGPLIYDAELINKPISPYLLKEPDWFMRHESGEYGRTYTRSLDLADPRYHKHVADVMMLLIEEYGADGFRLDAQMWCEFPSWKSETGRKPYDSLLGGFLMQDYCREIILKKYPDTLFYTETNGPLAARGHEYRYNYDHHWIWPGLIRYSDARGMASGIANYGSIGSLSWHDCANWLEETRLTLPEGINIVHHVDSHDSHEWLGCWGGQFNREAFGLSVHKPLMALAAFMEGGFMSYYGAEEGSEDFYKFILTLLDLPVMKGKCSYTAIKPIDSKTYAILRYTEDEWIILLGNLNSNPIKAKFEASNKYKLNFNNKVEILGMTEKEKDICFGKDNLQLDLNEFEVAIIRGCF